ncbi:hypothetical protein K443DRAFT_675057, partial [Laccaria amethystina LaAM-08-1]
MLVLETRSGLDFYLLHPVKKVNKRLTLQLMNTASARAIWKELKSAWLQWIHKADMSLRNLGICI